MPRYEDMDWNGLPSISPEDFQELMHVDTDQWQQELSLHTELFDKLQERLPRQLVLKRELMNMRLWK